MTISHFQSTVAASSAAGSSFDLSTLNTSYTDVGAATQTYGISVIFRTDGTVDVTKLIGSDLNNEVNPYVSPTSETSNTWVRCTYVSGTHLTGGSAEDTWVRCDAQKTFTLEYTSSGGNDEVDGTFNFELSSDASGSPVEATKNSVNLNVGETA